MRRWLLLFLLSSMGFAQSTQTPRQALLEIVKATSPAQVEKHTPEVLLEEMKKLPPEAQQRQQQSMMLLPMLMMASQQTIQTFETGPIFLVVKNPKENTRLEITVERDDLSGDTNNMEFGIHFTKNGQEQDLPFEPRIAIDMKLEKNVWRLSRLGGSASIRLDDPKVAASIVKSIQDQWNRQQAATAPQANPASPRTTAEARVVGSLRTLTTAEITYAATYSEVGFTCRLSDLGGGLGAKSPDQNAAKLIDPALESGIRNGYRIEITGCSGSPARSYKIIATPLQKGIAHPTYCTDESAVVRSVEEARSADCLTAGKPVN